MNIIKTNPCKGFCLALFIYSGGLLAQPTSIVAPYSTSFEEFDYWDSYQIMESQGWIEEGEPYTKKFIQGDARSGNVSLKLWSDIVSNSGLSKRMADATMIVDVSDANTDYMLDFYWKGIVKSTPVNPNASCIQLNELNNFQHDGIFLSDNYGESYVKVYDFNNPNGTWQQCNINLSHLAKINGLETNGHFRIKIQYNCWYGEEDVTLCKYEKHLLIDDVSITPVNKTTSKIIFSYDALGNRISRELTEINMTKSSQLDSADIKPLEEGLGEATVRIYPNPTKGMLRIEITGRATDQLYTAHLYSQSGNLVDQHRLTGNGHWPVDLTGQPSGYYVLVLQTGNHKKSYKIIKQQ